MAVLNVLAFALLHYVAMGCTAAACYILGRACFIRYRFQSKLESALVCSGTGLCLLACMVTTLCLLGVLYKWVVWSVLALMTTVSFIVLLRSQVLAQSARDCINELAEHLRGFKGKRLAVAVFISCALIVIYTAILINPLYPPHIYDSTSYHLAVAKSCIKTHSLAVTPYLRYPTSALGMDMLFTLMLVVYDDVSAQMISFLMMLMTGLLVYEWTRQYLSRSAGLLSASLWLGMPLVITLGSAAYIDIGLTLFASLAAYSFLNWIKNTKSCWLVPAAIFTGFTAAAKYTGAFFCIVFGVWCVIAAVKQRQLHKVLIFAAIALLISVPWYIRNYLISGNPVFPFMGSVFHDVFWNADDMRSQMEDLSRWGMGKSLRSLILLPWNLALKTGSFHPEDRINPLFFLLVPFSLICGICSKWLRPIALLAIAYILFWFAGSQCIRYLLPVVPLLIILTTYLIVNCINRFCKPTKLNARSLVIAAALVFSMFSAGMTWRLIMSLPPLPLTRTARDTWLTKVKPPYAALAFLNQKYSSDYTVYVLGDSTTAYFADGVFIGDWFGPGRYNDICKTGKTGRELYGKLTKLHATHFLASKPGIVGNYETPNDKSMQDNFKPVFQTQGVNNSQPVTWTLYELRRTK